MKLAFTAFTYVSMKTVVYAVVVVYYVS